VGSPRDYLSVDDEPWDMAPGDTPYVFRGTPGDDAVGDDGPAVDDGDELVIVDGEAMWYRRYRR
jgi:hypothetical protein